MHKPKTLPLRVSNAIFAWMQRYHLPDSFLEEEVKWDDLDGVYYFTYQGINYECSLDGRLK